MFPNVAVVVPLLLLSLIPLTSIRGFSTYHDRMESTLLVQTNLDGKGQGLLIESPSFPNATSQQAEFTLDYTDGCFGESSHDSSYRVSLRVLQSQKCRSLRDAPEGARARFVNPADYSKEKQLAHWILWHLPGIKKPRDTPERLHVLSRGKSLRDVCFLVYSLGSCYHGTKMHKVVVDGKYSYGGSAAADVPQVETFEVAVDVSDHIILSAGQFSDHIIRVAGNEYRKMNMGGRIIALTHTKWSNARRTPLEKTFMLLCLVSLCFMVSVLFFFSEHNIQCSPNSSDLYEEALAASNETTSAYDLQTTREDDGECSLDDESEQEQKRLLTPTGIEELEENLLMTPITRREQDAECFPGEDCLSSSNSESKQQGDQSMCPTQEEEEMENEKQLGISNIATQEEKIEGQSQSRSSLGANAIDGSNSIEATDQNNSLLSRGSRWLALQEPLNDWLSISPKDLNE